MIKKFINRLLGKTPAPSPSDDTSVVDKKGLLRKVSKPKFGKRHEFNLSEHGIDLAAVDERALDVVHTLKQAGFEAYIVGGAVRDLLLGLRPKDFDVATNATPEEVKALFRRAFIIGRRFRIVHVVYGRGRDHEVIEVSTFRAYLDSADAKQVKGNEKTSKHALEHTKHAVDASGRVLRDNVWGPQDEDAARRDFTINAMYYDPERQIVVDYHGGISDAKKKILRMIGEPAARYREDPVRIIRAVRFAAKLNALGFKFDSKTGAPLAQMRELLADVPQSRLFDEMLKLLQTGHSIASIEALKKHGLATGIYPLLDIVVERADQDFVHAALVDTDRRVGENKPVAPSFLLAAILWADVRDGWARNMANSRKRLAPFPALQEAVDEAFNARIGDVSGRGKLGADMREIWMMQPRFEKRTGSTPYSLVEQARFRAGFEFLRLRADVGEVPQTLADWWQEFSTASDTLRDDLVAEAKREQQAQPAIRTASKSTPKVSDPTAEQLTSDAATADTAPAKKRRRRRKPRGKDGSSDTGSGIQA